MNIYWKKAIYLILVKKNEEENKPLENYLEVHEDELDQKYLFHSQWD